MEKYFVSFYFLKQISQSILLNYLQRKEKYFFNVILILKSQKE